MSSGHRVNKLDAAGLMSVVLRMEVRGVMVTVPGQGTPRVPCKGAVQVLVTVICLPSSDRDFFD